MPTLELSKEEAVALRDLLETELSDLSHEISDTDRQDFREKLKAKKVMLESISRRLGAN